MPLGNFLKKQFIDVIQWTEDAPGVLAWRYPMQDQEIQYGGQLTVRESQMALFVNEGKVADAFGPGLHTLETRTLPLLTNLQHWDKAFQSPFKSDVYFFSTRQQTNQRWGTQSPVTVRDKDFGALRIRGNGVYAYHIENPLVFHQKLSGTQGTYSVGDLDGHLRNTIVGKVSDAFAESGIPFLDMAANLNELSKAMRDQLTPMFQELGLALDSFQVQSLSLPEELQKKLDERIGITMAGDLRQYSQYQAAQSMPIAAANEGGGAGLGAGLGAGMAMGKAMTDALASANPAGVVPPSAAPTPDSMFCRECGKTIPRSSKFCPECGKSLV